jgi:hypothetical protein
LERRDKLDNDKFYKLYDELVQISNEILPYYDIDKVKPYSVYIWTKGDDDEDYGENVFDIEENKICFYNKNHVIQDEVNPIIEKIQAKLKEINEYCK